MTAGIENPVHAATLIRPKFVGSELPAHSIRYGPTRTRDRSSRAKSMPITSVPPGGTEAGGSGRRWSGAAVRT